ncbi:MAG: T9SS type A sorting domain-containing protein, partial [Bacteroidales bacterium]|nr:T9SS type A sorting domain-containing protein [Bacteroidales bacterium]
ETLDTTGMVWTPMYNSIETFDEGAFSANATGHPDYGWGTYNMSTHNITGDSLFVIKTVAGTYKKLAIIMRGSMANTWEFKYANLDSTDEQSVLLNSGDYNTKNFVYYSVDNNEIVDREPAAVAWDLLFTKYYDYTIPYEVSGVLTNEDHVLAQEVKDDGLKSTSGIFEDTAFTSCASIIGSDWKSFNMGTFTYDVDSTIVYFLKTMGETDSAYYKLYFTAFDYTVGKYSFIQEKLSLVTLRSPEMIQILKVYPNPASDHINVLFDHTGETAIQIIDMTGRTVSSTIHRAGGFTNLSLDIAQLKPGLFFLKVNSGNKRGVIRFIKK